jgi:hypothetical protein
MPLASLIAVACDTDARYLLNISPIRVIHYPILILSKGPPTETPRMEFYKCCQKPRSGAKGQ